MSSSGSLDPGEVVAYLEMMRRLDALARTRPERSASLHLELARIRRMRSWGQIGADVSRERLGALSSALDAAENETRVGSEA